MKLVLDSGKEIPIKSLKGVVIKPGEVILLELGDDPIPQAVINDIWIDVKDLFFPAEVLIIHKGVTLKIISKAEAEEIK